MHILYLDDSGSPQNQSEEYFVLAGLSVPERSVRWLTSELDRLAERIEPTAPDTVEFHASDIFGGRGPIWSRFQKQQRIDIMKAVLATLRTAHADTVAFACAIHKASFQDDPVEQSYEEISGRFHLYLDRLNRTAGAPVRHDDQQRGIIVMDKSTYETNLQTLTAGFRRGGNRWGRQLRQICEVPFFVDSKASRIIQLADHIAYAVFRRYNARDINYFDQIQNRFDEEDGVIHGLIHKRPRNEPCTCPSCLTRPRRLESTASAR
jgi:hypothetical protein